MMRKWLALLLVVTAVLAVGGVTRRLLRYRPLGSRLPGPAKLEPRPTWGSALRNLSEPTVPAEQQGVMAGYVIEGATTPPLTGTTNILLAGLDTRLSEAELARTEPVAQAKTKPASRPSGHEGRTDALVVVVLDERSRHVGLVSIPRDLVVAIPGGEPNRINAVYNTGLHEGGPERGVALLKQTVHETLGLPIANVVLVDHAGFEALVDRLDGVPVAVRCPIRDRFIDARGPGGRLELKLDAGMHFLDGKTALMYARSRHGRGVFDRAVRQQAVLLGVRDRLLELGPARLAQTLPLVQRAAYSDLSTLDLLRLARRMLTIKREQIHGLVIGGREAEPTVLPDGRWVMFPKRDGLRDSLSRLFEAKAPGHRATECPDMNAALQR